MPMPKARSRFTPALSVVDGVLESRVVLSAAAHQIVAEVARDAATKTSLAVTAGTLGQPITFTATVRTVGSVGSPRGTVALVDHGQVIQTLTLTPATSTGARSASSEASYTLTPQPGGTAYFFGKHSISAEFIPAGAYSKSVASKTFTVSKPDYTTLAGGVKVATIAEGSGPQIATGQTAGVLYTGYLASNGHIFDDSINDGGTPFSFTLGAGQVIPGFDAGATGMRVGETRIVEIPPAEGYGATASGPIPGNSTLIFVVTLESIN